MVVERPKFGHRSPTKSSTKRDAFDVSPAKRSRMASLASSYDDASEKESMDTSPVVPAPTFSPRKEGTDNSEEERRSKRGKASSHKKEKKEKKEKKAKRKKKEKETSNKKKRTKDYKPNGDSSGETSS
ncbi:unnamed protein product [Soboliphyme baturini]|uniref:Protein FAM133-like n=1 Tax=Soboliphyme baturini TaxID=241478 RepID=A0A183J8U0_9BILA|nr:unnamed protein product [Soboliphyme baturini]